MLKLLYTRGLVHGCLHRWCPSALSLSCALSQSRIPWGRRGACSNAEAADGQGGAPAGAGRSSAASHPSFAVPAATTAAATAALALPRRRRQERLCQSCARQL